MSRRRRRSSIQTRGRDVDVISSGTLPRAQERVRWIDALRDSAAAADALGAGPWQPLSPYPDDELYRPARAPAARPVRRGSIVRSDPFFALRVLQVDVPRRVDFCIRRKIRKEVLFAQRKAGYRGSAKKRFWHRTANSQWRC